MVEPAYCPNGGIDTKRPHKAAPCTARFSKLIPITSQPVTRMPPTGRRQARRRAARLGSDRPLTHGRRRVHSRRRPCPRLRSRRRRRRSRDQPSSSPGRAAPRQAMYKPSSSVSGCPPGPTRDARGDRRFDRRSRSTRVGMCRRGRRSGRRQGRRQGACRRQPARRQSDAEATFGARTRAIGAIRPIGTRSGRSADCRRGGHPGSGRRRRSGRCSADAPERAVGRWCRYRRDAACIARSAGPCADAACRTACCAACSRHSRPLCQCRLPRRPCRLPHRPRLRPRRRFRRPLRRCRLLRHRLRLPRRPPPLQWCRRPDPRRFLGPAAASQRAHDRTRIDAQAADALEGDLRCHRRRRRPGRVARSGGIPRASS